MSLPIIVTHPSPLLHNGLRQLFAKSHFRPVRLATTLTQQLETYLLSVEHAIWLTGVEASPAATHALLRKILAANPRVQAVIMAESLEPTEIIAALKAGAYGYVQQDIDGETLLKSLELIAHGKMIVYPPPVFSETDCAKSRLAENLDDNVTHVQTIRRSVLSLPGQQGPASAGAQLENSDESGDIPSLSRREMRILHMLMQGASNKTIAVKLVITESTVKVHIKAILRKLRLQNRTQAALWARDNIEDDSGIQAVQPNP
jgi:two-component system nitrate/nitrite response regulator NarL